MSKKEVDLPVMSLPTKKFPIPMSSPDSNKPEEEASQNSRTTELRGH